MCIPGVSRCRRDGSGGIVVVRHAWLRCRLSRLWWQPVLVLVCGHAVLRGMRGQVLEMGGGYHAVGGVAAGGRGGIGLNGDWWTRRGCVGRGVDGRNARRVLRVLRVLRGIGDIVRWLRVGERGSRSAVTAFSCVSRVDWGRCGVRVTICHGDGLRRWLWVCMWLRIGEFVCWWMRRLRRSGSRLLSLAMHLLLLLQLVLVIVKGTRCGGHRVGSDLGPRTLNRRGWRRGRGSGGFELLDRRSALTWWFGRMRAGRKIATARVGVVHLSGGLGRHGLVGGAPARLSNVRGRRRRRRRVGQPGGRHVYRLLHRHLGRQRWAGGPDRVQGGRCESTSKGGCNKRRLAPWTMR